MISTLDFVPEPALEKEALIPASREEYIGLRTRLERVAASGREKRLDIHFQLVAFEDTSVSMPAEMDFAALLPDRRPACSENVLGAAFVSAGGDVSPCVFTHLPVTSAQAAAARMGRPYQPLIFGNVQEQTLEAIWDSRAYRAFRRSHRSGELMPPCAGCLKTRLIA